MGVCRWLGAQLIVVALTVGTVPAAHAESLAGHWRLTFYGACVDSPLNRQACRDLQSPAAFGAIGVSDSTLTVRGIGDYTADAQGRYTVRFITRVTEKVPGASRPTHCSNALVFRGTFSGSCIERGTGHGHIALGHSGMDEFWQDDATGAWDGSPRASFSENNTTDTMNPACTGVYNTHKFMALFGYHHVPAGIWARLVLTHTTH